MNVLFCFVFGDNFIGIDDDYFGVLCISGGGNCEWCGNGECECYENRFNREYVFFFCDELN